MPDPFPSSTAADSHGDKAAPRPAGQPVRRGPGLQTYLMLLMLAAIVPMLIASIYTVQHVAYAFRSSSLRYLGETATRLAHTAENHQDYRARLLQAYAADTETKPPAALAAWLAQSDIGADSEVFVASQLAPRHQHPSGIPTDLVLRALGSTKPVFSQLFFQDGKPRVAMATRLPHGKNRVLVLVMPPQRLVSALQNDAPPWMLFAITDGTGRLLARSVAPEQYIGTQVPDWAKLKRQGSNSGVFEAERADGGQVIFAFHQLEGTPGWMAVTGGPLGDFNSRWQKPIAGIVLAGMLALATAVLLCAWVARQLLRPIRQITEAARTGASYQRLADEQQTLVVQEYETLRQSLIDARDQLESALRTARALSLSEQRSRSLALAGAQAMWTLDPQGRALSIRSFEPLIGIADNQAPGWGWLRRIHREDVAMLRRDVAVLLSDGTQTIDVELRLRTSGDQWRWMRARGVAVHSPGQHRYEWLGVLEDVDERKREHAAVTYLAHHDPLTGLANRRQLQDYIAASGAGALLLLDLDRFKHINDTLGHAAGDALLRAVAGRLRGLLRESDQVVRLGGDEFCIVQHTRSRQAAASLAQRVIDTLSADYALDGQRASIGVSVGITLHAGHPPGAAPAELLRQADSALYQAKAQGRGRYAFYRS